MKGLRRFFKRMFWWIRAGENEARLRAEIDEHIALEIDKNLGSGMTPEEARREAVIKFGSIEAMKESYRDQRGLPRLESLIQDTRYCLRRLRLAPAFTLAIVATLALGIGATTSIFTLVHAVLMKSLPVAQPSELVRLGKETRCCYWGGYDQDVEFSLASYDLYKYFRDNTKGFRDLAAFAAGTTHFGVRRAGTSETAAVYPGEFVSGNYFAMFGLEAFAGRLLTNLDDRPDAPPVAVMSYRLWQQKYAADPSVIGAVFNLDNKPVRVIGITPPGFFGDTLRNAPPDFFLPLNSTAVVESAKDLNDQGLAWLDVMGRLAPGVTSNAVEAQMRVELKQWLYSHWGDMGPNARAKVANQTLYLSPGGAGITSMREQYEHWLQILMLVSGFVLLIACANVANLMLVRGLERRRETSLSMALGARASRVIREPLIESILLSLFGGAAGLAVAFVSARSIVHFAFPAQAAFANVPIDASPSAPVLLFAFGVSVFTGIAFGIAPAWMATRIDPIEALRGTGRSTARRGLFSRKALVVAQAALSLTLLASSGLLIAALSRLENQDFGFDQNRRLIARFNASLAGYQPEQLDALYRRIHDSIAEIPEVASVALCLYSPMNNNWGTGVWIDGKPEPGPKDDNFVSMNRTTGGFFDVMGNRIVQGRGILDEDTAATRHVAVVNEAFARKFFKNENPIGRFFGRTENHSSRMYEIVGVAKDARFTTSRLAKPIAPFYFLPVVQHDVPETDEGSHYLQDIVIEAKPGATVPAPAVIRAMAAIDPNLPVVSIRPLSEQVSGQFRQQRLIAQLTSMFGILSLVLASIGLYGVTAYNAGLRVNEVGIRMALGAGRGDVIRLILGGALGLILVGLLLGLPLTFAAGKFLGSQLYGANPYDPQVLLASMAALGLSALAASLVPALNASRISPLEALRAE